jgi:hypothetical protein
LLHCLPVDFGQPERLQGLRRNGLLDTISRIFLAGMISSFSRYRSRANARDICFLFNGKPKATAWMAASRGSAVACRLGAKQIGPKTPVGFYP